MSRGDLDAVWDVINDFRKDVASIDKRLGIVENESEHCKRKQDQTDDKIADMCEQLKKTDAAIQMKMAENTQELKSAFDEFGKLVAAQLTVLMEERMWRKGAESTAIGIAKHTPKIIIAIVSATFAATVVWMSKP